MDCVEQAEKIFKSLEKIKQKLDSLNPDDRTSLAKFKPEYEELLKDLEESKKLASCTVPVLKIHDSCVYQSPLEPLLLHDYALIPTEEEEYTIIDQIKLQGRRGNLKKIKSIVDDLYERYRNYVLGVKECPLDNSMDSILAGLGLSIDELVEGDDESEDDSNKEKE